MHEMKHTLAKQPYHILAKPEDIAERVLVVGDPGRVNKLADLLEDSRIVNTNRGYFIATGYFNGTRVSIACHGIGAPSAAIVFEELLMLGAKIIIRLGTCGGLKKDVEVGTIVVPIGAIYPLGGTIGMYVGFYDCYPAVPDPEVVLELERAFKEAGFKVFKGVVASSDAFHAEEEFSKRWTQKGAIAVEMECATLFVLSRLRNFKSGAVLMVIDNLATGEVISKEEREKLEKEAGMAALKALVRV